MEEIVYRSDAELLTNFIQNGTDGDFKAVVERHAGLVYQACLRELHGNASQAEDASQAVFIALAHKASTLTNTHTLGPWLLRTARYVALAQKREERRRKGRELRAATAAKREKIMDAGAKDWEDARPYLNEAVGSLKPKLQEAVVLHLLEGLSISEVAVQLKSSEESIKKRVQRGREKLQAFFHRKGFAFAGAALIMCIGQEAAAAPIALAGSCATAGLTFLSTATTASAAVGTAGAAGAASSLSTPIILAKGAIKMMFWAKMKTVAIITVAALTVSGAAAPTVVVVMAKDEIKQTISLEEAEVDATMALPEKKNPQPIAAQTEKEDISFQLKQGPYNIAGRVVDQDGNPMSDVLMDWGGRAWYDRKETDTDEGGYFDFIVVDKYETALYAIAPGYGVVVTGVTPPNQKIATNLVITLKPEKFISGTVVNEEGVPLSNARILNGLRVGPPQEATTDAEGNFTLGQLSEGSYKIGVLIRSQEYATYETEPYKAGASDVRIVMRKGGKLVGLVSDAETGEDIPDFRIYLALPNSQKNSGGFSVRLQEEGMEFMDAGGLFEFRRTMDPDFVCKLVAVAPGYMVGEIDEVKPGMPTEFLMQKSKPVTVQLIDSETGMEIEDAQVRFYYCTSPLHYFANRFPSPQNIENIDIPPFEPDSAEKGKYTFSQVGNGPWVLEVIVDGYTRNGKIFRDGVKEQAITLQMEAARNLTGILKTAKGLPPEDFKIIISTPGEGESVEAKVDKEGRFTIKDAPSGKKRIALLGEKSGIYLSWPLQVEPGKTDIVVDMSELYMLEGKVTCDGKAVANPGVSARNDPAVGGIFATGTGISDENGRYCIFIGKAGSYLGEASAKEGKAKFEIEIKEKRQTLDIQLVSGTISGAIVSKEGTPFQQARGYIYAYREKVEGEQPKEHFYKRFIKPRQDALRDLISAGSQFTQNGKFSITGLSAGKYRLQFHGQDLIESQITDFITLKSDSDHIDNIPLIIGETAGVNVNGVDADTGEAVSLIHAVGPGSSYNIAGAELLELKETSIGTYDLYVGAKGYQTTLVPEIEVKAGERPTITASMQKGGEIEITLKRKPPEASNYIQIYVILKDIEAGKAAYQSNGYLPNVIQLSCQSKDEHANFSYPYGAIAPGEYEATIYYQPNFMADPVGQFEVSFTIKSGEVTKLNLDEGEMLPYKEPPIITP